MALGRLNRHREPGMELVYDQEDPTERRRKIYNLSPKGRRVATAIEHIIDPETSPV